MINSKQLDREAYFSDPAHCLDCMEHLLAIRARGQYPRAFVNQDDTRHFEQRKPVIAELKTALPTGMVIRVKEDFWQWISVGCVAGWERLKEWGNAGFEEPLNFKNRINGGVRTSSPSEQMSKTLDDFNTAGLRQELADAYREVLNWYSANDNQHNTEYRKLKEKYIAAELKNRYPDFAFGVHQLRPLKRIVNHEAEKKWIATGIIPVEFPDKRPVSQPTRKDQQVKFDISLTPEPWKPDLRPEVIAYFDNNWDDIWQVFGKKIKEHAEKEGVTISIGSITYHIIDRASKMLDKLK